jgi:ubiquinone/menaquinone biosynthesis C-methylase UbiE
MYQTWSEWLNQMGAQPDAPVYEMVRQQVLTAAQPAPGETVVDVGAGLGLLTFPLARRVQPGGRVLAIEPSDDCRAQLLQTCQTLNDESTIEVRPGRAEALGLDDRSCDLIVTRSVLIYVHDKAQAFREFARALKPGGRMVCWEPINAYFSRTGRLHRWFDLSSLGDIAAAVAEAEKGYFALDEPMCNFTENDLLYAAEAAGFSTLKLSVEHEVAYEEMTLEDLKRRLGWDTHFVPTRPTFRELLAEHLAQAQIDALLDVIGRQLPGKKVRIEGATALLRGQINDEYSPT